MNKAVKWVLISLGIALTALFVTLVAMRGFAMRPFFLTGSRELGFHHSLGGVWFGMGLFMLFKVLLGATVLGLAVFGLVTLFKQSTKSPDTKASTAVPENQPASTHVDLQRTCVKCSQSLQSDWKNCPYCGKKQ